MNNNIFRKGLVMGLIVLFVGVSIVPSISGTYDFNKTGQINNLNYNEDPPGLEWHKTFGGSSDDVGYSIQLTSDGGYIITGATDSYGAGNYDIWLIKTNDIGDKQWDKTFGGSGDDVGRSVQQTSDGGYIITGSTDPYGAGDTDVWLIKTDSNGNLQWDKTFGSIVDLDRGWSVQQTSDGGYIITGATWSFYQDSTDVWLIKTDSNGNLQWDETYGGIYHEEGRSVQQTVDGGYIIVGAEDYSPYQSSDVWLIKTDSNGNLQWDKTFGDTSYDDGWSVQQTSDGGYIIIGVTGIFTSGDFDVWLIKTDSNGNLQWDKTFGGAFVDWGFSVQQTSDDGYIIIGYTSYGSGDVWLIKTDSNGNKQWDKSIGGFNEDWGWSVQKTSDGGYIITGSTASYGAGASDVWLIKVGYNQPPTAPEIDGESPGKVGVEYEYEFYSTDPDGDDILEYIIYWGDETLDETILGPFASGEKAEASHIWTTGGDYIITVKAKDMHGLFGPEGTLDVTMPRNRQTSNPLFLRLFERFPNAFPLLRQILM